MTEAPPSPVSSASIAAEASRRRTLAIISHPDAGKTTLTEKFLLYGGAVEEAGSVRARRNARRSTSDWMAMERERGISISSTILQFDAFGCRVNLLDTPGHEDFSEDTYRTLMAVDSAVMVLDSAKGIEPQTRKLFEVCSERGIPILTFINKLDHAGREPLDLLDEIESVLGIRAVPLNWPIGDGPTFRGVYDLRQRAVLSFERTEGGRYRAPMTVGDITDPALTNILGDKGHRDLQEAVDLIESALPRFEIAPFLAGQLTPVFFGSALNNFGVEPFLEAVVSLAPPPTPRVTEAGETVPASSEEFTGFIFKIQANMDPLHRDRMAFLRICSGRFERDMTVYHPRLGKKIRITRPHRLFGKERETVDEAYPGDVVGLVNPGAFAIGDTLTSGAKLRYPAIPRFQPETFATLTLVSLAKSKQFQAGLTQLEEEGAARVLFRRDGARNEPILAAVGALQFDVVAARLETEYNVQVRLAPMAHSRAVRVEPGVPSSGTYWPQGTILAEDREGAAVILFGSQWELDSSKKRNPDLTFSEWT